MKQPDLIPPSPRDLIALVRSRRFKASHQVDRHKVTLALADVLEAVLDGASPHPTGDREALLRDLDEGPRLTLLALSDWHDDDDQPEVACGLRWLAGHGKWPGRVNEFYRWGKSNPQYKVTASWTLPDLVLPELAGPPVSPQWLPVAEINSPRYARPSAALVDAAGAIGKLIEAGETLREDGK